MNIYGEDRTKYVFPMAHHYRSNELYVDIDNFGYQTSAISDGSPSNQCTLVNGSQDIIEVTTEDSSTIGIAGTNIESVAVQIYDGSRHDASDLLANGDFSAWSSGYSSPPDGWIFEPNCNWSVEAVAADTFAASGYEYSHVITLAPPSSTSNRSFKRSATVTAQTRHKLSVFYAKDHDKHAQYYIYDNSNGAFISTPTRFPEPELELGTNTTAFMHVIFDTPPGCGSISVGFHAEGLGDSVQIVGASIMQCTGNFGATNIISGRKFCGEQFNDYLCEYAHTTGKHSVILVASAVEANQLKIGGIRTAALLATLPDPLIGADLGIEYRQISNELPFGGTLTVTDRFNVDTLSLTINASMAVATEFIETAYRIIRNMPVWWAIENSGWAMFASIEAAPQLIMQTGDKQQITFQIKEAV